MRLTALIVILALVALGLVWWFTQRSESARQAKLTTWGEQLTAWSGETIAALPEEAILLAPEVSGGTAEHADQLAALQAACAASVADADVVAGLSTPPKNPGLDSGTEGYDAVAAVSERLTTGLTDYQASIADVSARTASFCAVYPALVQVSLDQAAGLATFQADLGECRLDDAGCLPVDTDTWSKIADAVAAAYTDPARSRATILSDGCPIEALDAVCTLQSEQDTELAGLYEAYASALRSGDRDQVSDAYDAISSAIDSQRAALGEAVAAVDPDADVSDPNLALAAYTAQWATDLDLARLTAQQALLAAIG